MFFQLRYIITHFVPIFIFWSSFSVRFHSFMRTHKRAGIHHIVRHSTEAFVFTKIHKIREHDQTLCLTFWRISLAVLFIAHIFFHASGIKSCVCLFIFALANHLSGAITFLFLLLLSHAPHQLNDELAMMKLLHWLIKHISIPSSLPSIKVMFCLPKSCALHHAGSSLKTKNWCASNSSIAFL